MVLLKSALTCKDKQIQTVIPRIVAMNVNLLCEVILQWWCIKSWFWWSRSWGANILFWSGFLVKPLRSAQDPAAAAASVYPVSPCHGIMSPVCTNTLWEFNSLTENISKVDLFCLGLFRRILFLLKLGALQYAILKTVLSVLSIILWTNGYFDLSDVSISNT